MLNDPLHAVWIFLSANFKRVSAVMHQFKYCMMGDRVMRLRFTPVDPCSSRDGVTSVFASAASTCNELELSIVDIF